MHYDSNTVIDFWFNNKPKWFVKEREFDTLIKERFLIVYNQAIKGKLENWKNKPESLLSLVIVLDQFPRNMFRDTPQAFSGDKISSILVKEAIEQEFDLNLNAEQRMFLYMPLMHSELLVDQELSVELYRKLENLDTLNYALAHYNIILQFGRFPHRNKILGRVSTNSELEFLLTPNSSF